MIIKFKLVPSTRNEWLGWFGDDLIKVRIDTTNGDNIQKGFLSFLKEDLGIEEKSIRIIKIENNLLVIEFPDIAWELFLTVVK